MDTYHIPGVFVFFQSLELNISCDINHLNKALSLGRPEETQDKKPQLSFAKSQS